MFAKAITALFYIVVQPTAVFGDRAKSLVCRDNREEHGFALVGHDYRRESAHHFGHCFFECSSEEKCQSVTYLWDQKECRLNKETKKSRPEDFIDNAAATYMENNFRGNLDNSLIPSKIEAHELTEDLLLLFSYSKERLKIFGSRLFLPRYLDKRWRWGGWWVLDRPDSFRGSLHSVLWHDNCTRLV